MKFVLDCLIQNVFAKFAGLEKKSNSMPGKHAVAKGQFVKLFFWFFKNKKMILQNFDDFFYLQTYF